MMNDIGGDLAVAELEESMGVAEEAESMVKSKANGKTENK